MLKKPKKGGQCNLYGLYWWFSNRRQQLKNRWYYHIIADNWLLGQDIDCKDNNAHLWLVGWLVCSLVTLDERLNLQTVKFWTRLVYEIFLFIFFFMLISFLVFNHTFGCLQRGRETGWRSTVVPIPYDHTIKCMEVFEFCEVLPTKKTPDIENVTCALWGNTVHK